MIKWCYENDLETIMILAILVMLLGLALYKITEPPEPSEPTVKQSCVDK